MPHSRFLNQALLAAALTLAPIAVFAVGHRALVPPAAQDGKAASLGDLAPLAKIVADTQAIAASGDLGGAERRISDFETTWDADEVAMKPLNGAAWKRIDRAADAAFTALRAGTPVPATVSASLDALATTVSNPY